MTVFGGIFGLIGLIMVAAMAAGKGKVNGSPAVAIVMGAIFAIIGFGIIFFGWRSYSRQRNGAISTCGSQQMGPVWSARLFLIFGSSGQSVG